MKTKRRLLIPLILLVCIASVFLSGSNDYPYVDFYYGGDYNDGTFIWSADYGETIDYYEVIEGYLPSGMYLYSTSSNLVLYGTPWQEGTFTVRYCVETSVRRAIVELTVYIKHNPGYDPQPKAVAPKLTKSPAGETVEAGGSAIFISRADNYSGIAWYLVRSDYGSYIPVESIGSYFDGAWAKNYYSEKVTIGGIPKSMNGWLIQCYFVNDYGETWSGAAPITVKNSSKPAPTPAPTTPPTPAPEPAKKPIISTQPASISAVMGQPCTLSVAASSPDSGELSYQWFESETNSKASMIPLVAAESSTLVVPQSEGTRYYCVVVTNNKNGTVDKLISDIVSVDFAPNVKPSQEPVPTPQGLAPTTAQPTAQPVAPSVPSASTSNVAVFALYAVIALLFVAVIIMAIALSKRNKH